MVKKYLKSLPTARKASQREAIPGREAEMEQNEAGGYTFKADSWLRFERFLILGTEGGSYYVGEKELTKQNTDNVRVCIKQDGVKAVKLITGISVAGRAPKNDPAIYCLAIAASEGNTETRREALAAIPAVCRIGTHLFSFCEYIDGMRGWGPALRKAVANWYTSKPEDKLAYQLVKYQQRNGWSHRDVLRLAHPQSNSAIYRWAVGKPLDAISITATKSGRKSKYSAARGELPAIIQAFEQGKVAKTDKAIIHLISEYGLTREMIPTEFQKSPAVWEALLQKMPLTAMIRSLGQMSAVGLLAPFSDASRLVVKRLSDATYLHKSRVHPLTVLLANLVYGSGHGLRGKLSWTTVPQVGDALDTAFYLAFDNVEPTGKNFCLGVDVSGSMLGGDVAGAPGLTPCMGAAVMSMLMARIEPNYFIGGFSTHFVDLGITAKDELASAMNKANNMNFGGTDTSVAINHAMRTGMPVDAFIIITDGMTWAGDTHTSQVLDKYRRISGRAAKLVVINMVATRTSIADPKDKGSLDVVGFDTSVPTIIRDFVGVPVKSQEDE